jgi:hypothetical protein
VNMVIVGRTVIVSRDYWNLDLAIAGIIKDTKDHNVSETGSVCVFRWGGWESLIHHSQIRLECTVISVFSNGANTFET